jgi:hypothetical protein
MIRSCVVQGQLIAVEAGKMQADGDMGAAYFERPPVTYAEEVVATSAAFPALHAHRKLSRAVLECAGLWSNKRELVAHRRLAQGTTDAGCVTRSSLLQSWQCLQMVTERIQSFCPWRAAWMCQEDDAAGIETKRLLDAALVNAETLVPTRLLSFWRTAFENADYGVYDIGSPCATPKSLASFTCTSTALEGIISSCEIPQRLLLPPSFDAACYADSTHCQSLSADERQNLLRDIIRATQDAPAPHARQTFNEACQEKGGGLSHDERADYNALKLARDSGCQELAEVERRLAAEIAKSQRLERQLAALEVLVARSGAFSVPMRDALLSMPVDAALVSEARGSGDVSVLHLGGHGTQGMLLAMSISHDTRIA